VKPEELYNLGTNIWSLQNIGITVEIVTFLWST